MTSSNTSVSSGSTSARPDDPLEIHRLLRRIWEKKTSHSTIRRILDGTLAQ